MGDDYRTKQITLPSLSFKEREIVYVKILTEMHKSERVDQSDDKREPATTCRVTNLQDGKDYILICPTLMVSSLQDIGAEYVDQCFEVRTTMKPMPGKQYKGVEVYGIKCGLDYSDYPTMIDPDGQEES